MCGLVKWQLDTKQISKSKLILQYLSEFTHLVVPRTCFGRKEGLEIKFAVHEISRKENGAFFL